MSGRNPDPRIDPLYLLAAIVEHLLSDELRAAEGDSLRAGWTLDEDPDAAPSSPAWIVVDAAGEPIARVLVEAIR